MEHYCPFCKERVIVSHYSRSNYELYRGVYWHPLCVKTRQDEVNGKILVALVFLPIIFILCLLVFNK